MFFEYLEFVYQIIVIIGISLMIGVELQSIFFPSKKILVKYHTDGIEMKEIEVGDWQDLKAAETVSLKPGDFYKVSLGVSVKLPQGYEAHIVPRSSAFDKWGVIQTNGMGVIDESYCGENDIWKMPVFAIRDSIIEKGDRICQFRIMKKQPRLEKTPADRMYGKNRGGFGSTGKK
jgi:dUTP pyrophosphatase